MNTMGDRGGRRPVLWLRGERPECVLDRTTVRRVGDSRIGRVAAAPTSNHQPDDQTACGHHASLRLRDTLAGMIAYSDLVAALRHWRERNGLPNFGTDPGPAPAVVLKAPPGPPGPPPGLVRSGPPVAPGASVEVDDEIEAHENRERGDLRERGQRLRAELRGRAAPVRAHRAGRAAGLRHRPERGVEVPGHHRLHRPGHDQSGDVRRDRDARRRLRVRELAGADAAAARGHQAGHRQRARRRHRR